MSFEPKFERTQTERQDDKNPGQKIHNESSKLPDHEERMVAHCKRVKERLHTNPDLRYLKGKQSSSQPIKTGCAIPKAFE